MDKTIRRPRSAEIGSVLTPGELGLFGPFAGRAGHSYNQIWMRFFLHRMESASFLNR
jgi:hypothetical protein